MNPHQHTNRAASHRNSAIAWLVVSLLGFALMMTGPQNDNSMRVLRLMFGFAIGLCLLSCLGMWYRAAGQPDETKRLMKQAGVIAAIAVILSLVISIQVYVPFVVFDFDH